MEIVTKIAPMALALIMLGLGLGLTSEDVNSLAYALMIREIKDETIVSINTLNKELKSLVTKYKKISFLARTHGQPASPSTLGKEILVFVDSIN